jgi:hypothetical protein
MPQFPSFFTTGSTVVLPTQPAQYRPFNLGPMVQSIRERPQSKKTKPTTPKAEDFEIEGRIGAVNQYMRPINRKLQMMENRVALYGAAAYDMPEYAQDMRELATLSNEQRQNIVSEETKMRDNYKKNTEGKGALYDLYNLKKTGELKTASQWNEINQYAETEDLGDPQTQETWRKGFDENPMFYTIEDARIGVDALFKEVGVFERGGASEVLQEGFLEDLYGVVSEYNSHMSRVNFSGDPNEGDMLEAAKRQAWSRALGGVDFSDPIMAGYFQAFLQKTDGLSAYMNKNGRMDEKSEERWQNDFKNFVESDLDEHYKKRKIDIFKTDQRKSFNEADPSYYDRAEEAQIIEEYLAARKQQTVTMESRDNLGIGMDQVMNQDYLYSTEERDFVLAGGDSPFVVQQDGDGNNFVSVNEDYDEEALRARAIEYFNQKFPDGNPNAMIMADGHGAKTAQEYADLIVSRTNARRDKIANDMSSGRGRLGTTRMVIDEDYIPTGTVPTPMLEGVNSKFLVGKTAKELGTGNVALVGESFINMTSFGDAVYEGAGGALYMGPNTISSNAGIAVPTENGGTRIVRFASEEWQKMDEAGRQRLAQNGQFGVFNHDGSLADAGAFQGQPMPMDEGTQKALATMMVNGNLNTAYYSPAALRMNATLSYKDEKEAAKSLEGQYFKKEVPVRYKVGNSAYDRAYEKLTSTPGLFTDTRVALKLTREDDYKMTENDAKLILRNTDISPTSKEGQTFIETFVGMDKRNMSKAAVWDALTHAKLGKLDKAWNYKTAVVMKDQPISDGKKLDRDYKTQMEWRDGIGSNGEKRKMVTVKMNVTDHALNGIEDRKNRRIVKGFTDQWMMNWAQERAISKDVNKQGQVQTKTYGSFGFGSNSN